MGRGRICRWAVLALVIAVATTLLTIVVVNRHGASTTIDADGGTAYSADGRVVASRFCPGRRRPRHRDHDHFGCRGSTARFKSRRSDPRSRSIQLDATRARAG